MLRDVYAALADLLRTEIGDTLAGDDIDAEIEPRMVLAPSESPCIDIYPGVPSRSSDEAAFGDISGFEVVTVRARVTLNDTDESQDVLVDFNDDTHALSVPVAVMSDQTLDGWATSVVVDMDSFSGVLDFSTGTQRMVGCTWRVLIARAES